MAWRFKASKYKNAAPLVPKPENCIRDISVGSYQTYGNNITASAMFMAFNVDHAGSNLAILPINDCGRKPKNMPLLYAHSDTVTDMDFSPFHDNLLATGSQDCMVKLWTIPDNGLTENLSNAQCMLNHGHRRVENVTFHPVCDALLTTTSVSSLFLWDLVEQKKVFSYNDHGDVVQSLSWKQDGQLLVTSCKDKQLRVIDPRCNSANGAVTHSCISHHGIKDSRVVWLGNMNRILTTGFNSSRQREIIMRDLRVMNQPEKTLCLDSSTGILIPLFDPDTNMLFLAGKGDITILYMEVTDREPFLVEGLRHTGEQTKGACLVPKRALKVMEAEVNRVLQLTSSMVIPIMYQVPRKSYRDFHADLYPETNGAVSPLKPKEWLTGANNPVPKISLDPAAERAESVLYASLEDLCSALQNRASAHHKPKSVTEESTPAVKSISESSRIFQSPFIKNDDERVMNGARKLKENNAINLRDSNIEKSVSTPPKPLPRVSRALSEQIEDVYQKPVARPRTNSLASSGTLNSGTPGPPTVSSIQVNIYKPRLGPKPFSAPKLKDLGETSPTSEFDKVFSVPSAPKSMYGANCVQNGHHASKPDYHSNKDAANHNHENGSDSLNSSDDSSAEKIISPGLEKQSSSDSDGKTDSETKSEDIDAPDCFKRDRVDRSSFADRRKMYQEEPSNMTSVPKMEPKKENGTKILTPATPTPKRTSTVFGRVSKFRHLKGTPGHKSTHIENIRNLSRQISGESDGFYANGERAAIVLGGPGGKLAILELNKTGKLPDGVLPTLVNGTNVMDFAWDPFNSSRLIAVCDEGSIKEWIVPEGGLQEPTNSPKHSFSCNSDKIFSVKFHPLAENVMATVSHDLMIRVWDLESYTVVHTLKGHQDQVMSFAWSPCGKYIATICKDNCLRIYNPRASSTPVKQGKGGPGGSRGARITWVLDGTCLVVLGFDKVSERKIILFSKENLDTPISTFSLDVSPSTLIPFYDEDGSTLFLTGRGDSIIFAFEVSDESPYLCPLSHHRCPSQNQGLAFLPKIYCDVGAVEFAKALRLTNSSIEPLSFTVPRIKTELFQDDLFPPTRVTWKPTITAAEWFSGRDKPCPRISLKPSEMTSLSEVQNKSNNINEMSSGLENVEIKHPVSKDIPVHQWNSESAKNVQERIQRSIFSSIEVDTTLEQDKMEGVDESEWDD
nr:PREDICTED: coronin-7 isoform X1 [Bemisia tabaci]XP_018900732.1 PREDICTED: coronin-7 isoform X1 [Bemisia tabaci]